MTKRACFIGLCLFLTACTTALAEEETDYFAVFMQGKKVGYAVHNRAVQGGRVTTTEEVSITISRLGMPVTIKSTETSVETLAGKPLAFESVQNLGAMIMKVAGTIKGDVVHLTTMSMGMEEKSTMPWPKGAVMAEGLRLKTLKEGLEPGAEYTVDLFPASVMQMIAVRVTVGQKTDVDLLGRVVRLTEVTTTMSLPMAGAVTSITYVDDEMRALKNTMPIAGMTVEMLACPKEFALGENDVLEFIDSMFVRSPEPIDNVSGISAITYTLRVNPGTDLVIPSSDNQKAQRLADGRIVLTVEPVQAPAGGTLPYRGDDPKLREAIKPSRFLQSDRREIINLARKAVGDAKDAAEAARRIESFVARYIDDRSLSVGYASAAEVLESRQGDCSEFAVLTAALCRAVGIPAQVVVGIAYVRAFGGIEGFGGHAWTRAYVGGDKEGRGGRWIGLDASFKGGGCGGYDAGHIALAMGNGEPGNFFNMASALGKFKIESIDVQRAD
jgi:hypothetical protein